MAILEIKSLDIIRVHKYMTFVGDYHAAGPSTYVGLSVPEGLSPSGELACALWCNMSRQPITGGPSFKPIRFRVEREKNSGHAVVSDVLRCLWPSLYPKTEDCWLCKGWSIINYLDRFLGSSCFLSYVIAVHVLENHIGIWCFYQYVLTVVFVIHSLLTGLQ